jgi:hypothetical protein
VDAIFTALKAYWAQWGIQPNAGATEAELQAHETEYGLSLPEDMRAYFLAVNGMSSGPESRRDMDDDLIRFYSLAECRPLDAEWPDSGVPDAGSVLCFADYSIWCWGYGARLSREASPGPVHVLYNPETVKVADSFREFLESYLRRDYAVTFPR